MEKFKAFLKRKDIEISLKRYGIDALGAMAQGLFCSLLIGTIINTIGTQFHIPFLTMPVATVNDTQYTVGSLASAMSGPAMAVAIGYALHCPPLVLFSLITVGFASNALGGAGGPLAVLFVAIVAAEIGKGNEDRYPCNASCNHRCGRRSFRMVGTCPWKSCYESRKRDHVGNRSAAILYGNPGFCICWNRTDAADLFCCDLRSSGTYRTGRRRCSSGLLCADGRFCGHVLQGKQMGRSCLSGNWNFHAPDG